MFRSRKSKRVGPLTKKESKAASFLSPCTAATSDPADMFVAGRLNPSAANFDKLLPSTSRSDIEHNHDGAGDFESSGASHLPQKRGSAMKRLSKKQRVAHRQKVTFREPPNEPESKSSDKKEKSQRGLLKWIYNKLKPKRKSFKSAKNEAKQELDNKAEQPDPKSVYTSLDPCSVQSTILDQDQELDNDGMSAHTSTIPPEEEVKSSLISLFTGYTVFKETDDLSETADDSIPTIAAVEKNSSGTKETAENSRNTAVKSCGKDLCERKSDKTLEKMKEQVKGDSSQAEDSHQAGNVIIRDIQPLEPDLGSVEGNMDTPGSHRLFKFRKNVFFFDTDPCFLESKQHSNAGPAVVAEKHSISGDTDTGVILPSHRTANQSAITDQQLISNNQDKDQKGSEQISSKIVGSLTEPSNFSKMVIDPLETPRQFNTECAPNQGRRYPELSFDDFSDNFERRIYRRCLEMYMNACLRQWHEINPRGSSESATTEPPTPSTEGWTETVPKKLSSKPEAPPGNAGSTRSRHKGFRDLSKRVGPLTKKESEAASFLSPCTAATSDPADMFVAGRLNPSAANFDKLLPSTSRSDTEHNQDGAGDFESSGASHLPQKRGSAMKRLSKKQRVAHRQKVTFREPSDEPESKSSDKKGKSQRGLLKWIYNKLKPKRKSFKSAKNEAKQKLDNKAEQPDPKSVYTYLDPCSVQSTILDQDQDQELKFKETDDLSETADDSIPTIAAVEKNSSCIKETAENSRNTAVKSCGKDLCERKSDKTLEKMKEQVKGDSSQAEDSHQAGNVIIRDIPPLEPDLGSVDGNMDTPGSHRMFRLTKNVFFFDTDPCFLESKQHSNAGPAVVAEKHSISGDTDTGVILPSHRTANQSAITDQQLISNNQDKDQKGSEQISSKIVGSPTEASNFSKMVIDPLETPRQFNMDCPPNQGRRSPTELSSDDFSDNFERRIYRRCLEMYMDFCLRQWHEMIARGSSESATKEPPTSSTETGTETVPKKLSSKPKAPPKNAGSTRSRHKGFRDLVRRKLSRLFKMRIVVTIHF